LTDEIENAVIGGCPDAVGLGISNCVPHIAFSIEANSLLDAVVSAIQQVESLGIGAKVQRLEPDELVGLSDIGRRIGVTRESVRLYANGERGPGGFPHPVATPSKNARVWKWLDVLKWYTDNRLSNVDKEMTKDAATIATINSALELRRHDGTKKAMLELWKELQTPAMSDQGV
jgi:hypothetical protein